MGKRLALAIIGGFVFLLSCSKKSDNSQPPVTPPLPPVTSDNDHLLMGNPTNAVNDAAYPNNYLKDNVYYKIGYSNGRGEPIWVSWHLQSDDLGSAPRQNDFRADTQLPGSWYHVSTSSYTGSGFDRGHDCPSADRTSTVTANSATFLMTNMIPMAPTLNQGPWAGLEDFIRDSLVGSNNEAYIVMGSYGAGGNGSNGTAAIIDNGNVTVPAKVYKIILVLAKANNDLSRFRSTTTTLAVKMPNDNSLYTTTSTGKKAWRNYLTTINAIEQDAATYNMTLNFLSNVPDSVRPALKAKLYQ